MSLMLTTNYVYDEIQRVFDRMKCGESALSVVPTMLWGLGSAALAHRMLDALFKRFLFRRVPLWEIVVQDLMFIWLVVYSLRFWTLLVVTIKLFIDYCYDDLSLTPMTEEDISSRSFMTQWAIWMCGAMPLVTYMYTRPKPDPPIIMWITPSPWQRRELGPHGYYLSRPPLAAAAPPAPELTRAQHQLALRKSASDSQERGTRGRKRRRRARSV